MDGMDGMDSLECLERLELCGICCNVVDVRTDDALIRMECNKTLCGITTYHHNCIVVHVGNSADPQDKVRVSNIKRYRHSSLKGMTCPCKDCAGTIIATELVASKNTPLPRPRPKPKTASKPKAKAASKTKPKLKPMPKSKLKPMLKLKSKLKGVSKTRPKPKTVSRPKTKPTQDLAPTHSCPIHRRQQPLSLKPKRKVVSYDISAVIYDDDTMELVKMLLGEIEPSPGFQAVVHGTVCA